MSAVIKSVQEQHIQEIEFDFECTWKLEVQSGIHYQYNNDSSKFEGCSYSQILEDLTRKAAEFKEKTGKPGFVFILTITEGSNTSNPTQTVIKDIKALEEFISTFKQKYATLCQPAGSVNGTLKSP